MQSIKLAELGVSSLNEEDDLTHISCCVNNNIALCGVDITWADEKPMSTEVDCKLCAVSESDFYDACPFLGQCFHG